MILQYDLTDNILAKEDPTSYPNHLQDNITLKFNKTSDLPDDSSYYAYIKTTDAVKKVKINNENGEFSCELPLFVSHYPFFKLQVMTVTNEKRFVSNELIIPFKTSDYLDYNRSINQLFNRKYKIRDKNSGFDGEQQTIVDSYSKDELNDLLSEKADLVHQHQAEDITDWDEEVDENIDVLLFNLTNRIRGI